jgi:hypothetical protein
MPRHLLLVSLLLLEGCQGNPMHPPTSSTTSTEGAPGDFNRDTVQTYDLQSGEFQQQPPFGARADRAQ